MSPRPLSLADPEACAILRKVLADADYTHDGLTRALGLSTYASAALTEFPVLLKALAPGTPLSILIQVFLLGYPVDVAAIEPVIRPLTPERLEALGVIMIESGSVLPQVRLRLYRGYLFAADRRPKEIKDITPDFVLEINPTSAHVADITPRRRVASALDIGSGSGVLSILAAAHCDKVVATDINPRALNFTAFNAQLNGVSNIECLQGSLLDPVAGRTFDLVMSNPPFVISPDTDYQFRDSGWARDGFCRELVRRIPAHLNEGGIGLLLCDWPLRKGEVWSAVAAEWVAGSGCDSVVFRTKTQTTFEYATNWNRPQLSSQPKVYEAALERWVEYLRKLEIESIASGRIILRRRASEKPWMFTVDDAEKWSPTSGEHLLRIIEGRDWITSGVGPEDLLKSVFRPSDDLRMEQTLEFQDEGMAPVAMWASLAGGFHLRGKIDTLVWHVLLLCDGRRPLREIVNELVEMSGKGSEILNPRVVAAVRDLYAAGFLIRV